MKCYYPFPSLIIFLFFLPLADQAQLKRQMFSDCEETICLRSEKIESDLSHPYHLVLTNAEDSFFYPTYQTVHIDDRNDSNWIITISYNWKIYKTIQIGDSYFSWDENKGEVEGPLTPGNKEVPVKPTFLESWDEIQKKFCRFSLTSYGDDNSVFDDLRIYSSSVVSLPVFYSDDDDYDDDDSGIEKLRSDAPWTEFVLKRNASRLSPRTEFILRRNTECPNKTIDKEHEPRAVEATSDALLGAFTCESNEELMINKQLVGYNIILCGKHGWYSPIKEGKVANFTGQTIFCIKRCDPYFIISEGTLDGSNQLIRPLFNSTTNETSCKHAFASMEVFISDTNRSENILSDKVQCNEYGDFQFGEELNYRDINNFTQNSIKMRLECFGAFMFLSNNCETSQEKASIGCIKPDFTEGIIFCAAGYKLVLEDTIYSKLSVIGGHWFADNSNKTVGRVKKDVKPMCLSKCSPLHFNHYDASTKIHYEYDATSNGGKLTCGDNKFIASTVAPGNIYKQIYCQSESGLIGDGEVLKTFSNVSSLSDLRITFQCIDVCPLRNSCNGTSGCQNYTYVNFTLKCPERTVLFVNGKVMSQALYCSNEGWTTGEGMTLLEDRWVDVKCIDYCSPSFFHLDTNLTTNMYQYDYETHSGIVKCDHKFIAHESKPDRLFENVKCDPMNGYIGDGILLSNFSNLLVPESGIFTANCVPKCDPSNVAHTNRNSTKNVVAYSSTDSTWKCGRNQLIRTNLSREDLVEKLKCDSQRGYIGDGKVLKDFSRVSTKSDLVFTAICAESCPNSIIHNDCNGKKGCEKYLFNDFKLSCPQKTVLFVDGIRMDTSLICTNEGWILEGETKALNGFDMNRENQVVNVKCRDYCSDIFLTKLNIPPEYQGNKLSCKNGKGLKMTVLGTNSSITATNSLDCDPERGWSDGSKILFDFSTGFQFNVECVSVQSAASYLIFPAFLPIFIIAVVIIICIFMINSKAKAQDVKRENKRRKRIKKRNASPKSPYFSPAK